MNKQERKQRKVNNNENMVLLKSTIYVFSIMLTILMPLIFVTNLALAEDLRYEYKYTFNFGDKYVYEIITEESSNLVEEIEKDPEAIIFNTDKFNSYIKLVSSRYSEIPSDKRSDKEANDLCDKLNTDQLGSVTLRNYAMLQCYKTTAKISSGKGDYKTVADARDIMKYLMFSILDLNRDNMVIVNGEGDGEDYIRYMENGDNPDDDEEDYNWGTYQDFWLGKTCYKDKLFSEALVGTGIWPNEKGFLHPTSSFSTKLKILNPTRDGSNEQLLSYALNKDIVVALLATFNENRFGFEKERIKVDKIVKSGDFAYKILQDTINLKDETVDIEILYKHDGEDAYEKLFTFRYKLSTASNFEDGLIDSTKVTLANDTERTNTSVMNSTSNEVYRLYPGEKDVGLGNRILTFPRVIGAATYNGLDIAYDSDYYVNTELGYHIEKNGTLTLPLIPKDRNRNPTTTQGYYGICKLPVAICRNNYVEVLIIDNYGYEVVHGSGYNTIRSYLPIGLKCPKGDSINPSKDPTNLAKSELLIPCSTIDRIIENYKIENGIEISDEDSDFPTISSGNWTLKWDKEKDWLIASNVENLEAAGYPKIFTMDFSKNGFKAIGAEYFINSSDKSYDAELKKIEETTMTSSVRKGDNFYWFSESGSQEHSNYAAILIATDEILSDESIPWVNSLDRIVSDIATSQRQTIQLVFYRDKDSTKRGMDVSQDKLVLNATKNILEDKNGKPVVFDITLWFNEEYNDLINKEVEEVTNGDDKKFDFVIMDAETLTENETKFYTALFKYSKPIMMFLIFVVIMYTGIYSIMTNQDAKARVLVKEKVKHILIGVVMFACVVMILWLCKSFMEANFAKIQEVTESNIESTVDVVEADIEQSWFVEILTTFINSIAEMVKWLRVSILAKVVGNGQAAEPFDLVFNSGQAVDYTLAPFSKIEWERYMYGYRALEALALALVAIALIKVSAEHVINAGNSEKIAESKQAILRMGIAMLCIVLGPYIVRLILTLFNYLLILVPLKDIELELAFGSGIVASVAGVMYQWVLLKIYFVFLVRKLMITFMLLLTPVVFGLWAISNKFRSLSLWIGELVTNSATQLCYALVFFVGSLIMFSGQSDFITLILVMMFMQLADFFKDSLQGLVQKWGGINETGVAEGLASGVLSVGKQTINYSTKASKFIGGTLQERSKTIDPERVTDKGRRMYNVGAVMRGDIFGLESKSKMNKNVSKKYEVHARENEEIVRSEKKKAAAQSEEYQKHFNDVFEGREQYDPNKEYDNDTQKHAYQSADKARKAEDKAARLRKGIQEADEEAKNTRTIKERIQDKVKENALKNSERDLGSFETLDDFRKATSQIGKSFNESSDSLAKKEASLDIMKQMKEERRGAVSNEQVKSICKSAIQEIAQLEASNNDKDKVANITTSIKQKIAEALQDVGTLDGELKDVRDEYQKVPNNTNVNSPEYIKYAATRDKRREDMQDSFKLKKS